MQGEEDLSRPLPIKHERPIDPDQDPYDLENTLDRHSAPFPSEPALTVPIHLVERQA